jgi:type II secretory pathway pseudopilin PulG
MNTVAVAIIIIAALIVIAVLVWLFARRRRSQRLRSHFGPEYDHAVRELGSQTRAEDALAARQKRMEHIQIHSLSPEERERFASRWHDVQARFVDDPEGAIRDADALVNQTMVARGYPMGEFEARAENLSVDHPKVVRNYRAAHAIAVRRDRGDATTEDMRHALVYYRDLFEELLEYQGVR